MALTIKKKWLDLILASRKTWEIRGTSTKRRGFIHFAESGSGQLRGRAKLVGCRQLNRRKLMKYQHKHQVPNAEMVTYKNIWAWILKDAEPYENSFHYSHTQGAVIFVKVRKPMGPGNRGNANASAKKRKATAAAGKRQSRGLAATSVEPPTGPEDCQNCNVPRNQHCGSREAPNEKKNKPAKEQWKFVVDPTSEPSWSDVALYEEDLHRKNARSIMTPQPNMSTTSEASTTRWKRSQSRRAKKRWRRRTLINVYLESEHPEICLRRGQREATPSWWCSTTQSFTLPVEVRNMVRGRT